MITSFDGNPSIPGMILEFTASNFIERNCNKQFKYFRPKLNIQATD